MSLFVTVLVAAFLIAIQGLLLQVACTVAGEDAPPYGQAWSTALIAGILSTIVTTAFGCTAGLIISLFSTWLAYGLAILLGVSVTGIVFRNRLHLSNPQAIGIAVVHQLLVYAVSGLLWALVRYLW